MAGDSHRLERFGGISFIVTGSLFLGKSVLELVTGPPPSKGAEILAWMSSRQGLLAVTNEVLFFAVAFLVPAVIALYGSLRRTGSASVLAGCGVLAVTIPVSCVLLILHGRLAFPVYGIEVHTPDIAEFVIAVYYGGEHAVLLLFAVATFLLSLGMRREASGRFTAGVGFVTAILDVVGSYPWAIGPALGLVCAVLFSTWLVAMGVYLLSLKLPPAQPQSGSP